ncbi:DUF4142 domain-containing protein [Mesorhizobium sp. PUT5]|uniref:DUF4142 domain-containing protein n=1 Tax=Mesorhizobium sp. PUT5 TaxID=3454629 RepID=UPI003FA48A0D
MRYLLSIAAVAMLAAAPAAFAASDTSGTAPATDQSMSNGAMSNGAMSGMAMDKVDTDSFVKTAASANAFEIETSKQAEKDASSADVKAFAKDMIKDHTRIGKHFEKALSKGKVTAPSGAELQPDDQAKLDQLKGLSGDAFQAKYLELQTAAHKDAVALFTEYSKSGDNKALKTFAKETLPVLEKHEKHVEKLDKAHAV